jgi:hypothetical protein
MHIAPYFIGQNLTYSTTEMDAKESKYNEDEIEPLKKEIIQKEAEYKLALANDEEFNVLKKIRDSLQN